MLEIRATSDMLSGIPCNIASSIGNRPKEIGVNAAISNEQKVRENLLRRVAERQGFALQKSRARDPRSLEYEGWRIVDPATNVLVYGDFRTTTIDDIEAYLVPKVEVRDPEAEPALFFERGGRGVVTYEGNLSWRLNYVEDPAKEDTTFETYVLAGIPEDDEDGALRAAQRHLAEVDRDLLAEKQQGERDY